MVKGFIITSGFEVAENNYIKLYGRLEDGRSFLSTSTYQPYFYIKTSDIDAAKKILDIPYTPTALKTLEEEPVSRAQTKSPKDISKIR